MALPGDRSDVPTVSVVIVSYNTQALTLACLDALAGSVGVDHEVVVVDNDSSDGSADAIRRAHPDVTVIESGGNLGFAKGVNLGAAKTTGRRLLLLNPDAEVGPNTLQALVAAAELHPEHGLYGGLIRNPDGSINTTTARGLPTSWSLLCHGLGLTTIFPGHPLLDPERLGRWDRTSTRPVPMLTGALLLIDRVAWDRLGGFRAHYFMYGEDADLCHRAAELGYSPLFVAEAEIVHAPGSASADRTDKLILMRTGEATYLRDNWQGWRLRFALAMLASGVALRAITGRVLDGRGVDWRRVWAERPRWLAGFG